MRCVLFVVCYVLLLAACMCLVAALFVVRCVLFLVVLFDVSCFGAHCVWRVVDMYVVVFC